MKIKAGVNGLYFRTTLLLIQLEPSVKSPYFKVFWVAGLPDNARNRCPAGDINRTPNRSAGAFFFSWGGGFVFLHARVSCARAVRAFGG